MDRNYSQAPFILFKTHSLKGSSGDDGYQNAWGHFDYNKNDLSSTKKAALTQKFQNQIADDKQTAKSSFRNSLKSGGITAAGYLLAATSAVLAAVSFNTNPFLYPEAMFSGFGALALFNERFGNSPAKIHNVNFQYTKWEHKKSQEAAQSAKDKDHALFLINGQDATHCVNPTETLQWASHYARKPGYGT